MKTTILVLLLATSLVLAACAQPPADVPKATVEENKDAPAAPQPAEEKGTPVEEATEEVEEEVTSEEETTTVSINTETSTFTFEGFGPGKSHEGTFDFFEGELTMTDGQIVGAKGVIDATSVNTGIEGLDTHLKAADFFDVEAYPQITFESSSVTDTQMVGTLDFHGVSKEITFPVQRTADSLSADFLLDVTAYNMEYTGINDEVRISFEMKA